MAGFQGNAQICEQTDLLGRWLAFPKQGWEGAALAPHQAECPPHSSGVNSIQVPSAQSEVGMSKGEIRRYY